MRELSCVLCKQSKETKITGALSTKNDVTAHQNCLLYSSGIFCANTPEFDELFGFSIEDVQEEVTRGRQLICHKCKKKGATAGCEVRRCKKSFHYPCAVEAGAELFEDTEEEKYGLYCFSHSQRRKNANNGSVSRTGSSGSASSSKVYCLVCEKIERNLRLENVSNGSNMLYCDKHAPLSHKRNTDDDSAVAGPSGCSSGSNTPNNHHVPSKRRLPDKEHKTPSKRRKGCHKIMPYDSSNSDETLSNTPMEMFAPLDTDPDDSDSEQHDNDSESLLLPVENGTNPQSLSTTSELETKSASSSTQTIAVLKKKVEGGRPERNPVQGLDDQTSGQSRPPPSPNDSESQHPPVSPPQPSGAMSSTLPETSTRLLSSSRPVNGPPHNREPSIDSSSFWKSCNIAGCTQAIFTDFISEMNNVSSRILSDLASQKDYDLALTVMKASGKLAEFVAKQEKSLQQKQLELTKTAAAMKEVVSALRR